MGFPAIIHEEPPRWCDVTEDGCEAVPDKKKETRAECHACGNPVCTSPGCSRVRAYFGKRRRICTNCAEMHELV